MEVKVKDQKETADNQNEVLTVEQIKSIVGRGWALIKNPVYDGCIFLKGELLFHSADEDEAYEALRVMRKEHRVLFKHFVDRDPNVAYLFGFRTL